MCFKCTIWGVSSVRLGVDVVRSKVLWRWDSEVRRAMKTWMRRWRRTGWRLDGRRRTKDSNGMFECVDLLEEDGFFTAE